VYLAITADSCPASAITFLILLSASAAKGFSVAISIFIVSYNLFIEVAKIIFFFENTDMWIKINSVKTTRGTSQQ
jgi:hypothetical protein